MSNDCLSHTFLVTVKNADALLRTLGARVEGKKRFREICFGCSRAASAKAPHSGEWGRDRLFSAAHSSTTNPLTATALIYAFGAGITAGAGTRLVLQSLLDIGWV